jgi:hypothetical protein
LRRSIEPALRLPEAPDVVESVEAIEAIEEDRRRGQAPGYPYRAPTMGRRKSRRQRVLLAALIVEFESDNIIRCRVDNVSENGGRIRLSEPRFLPASFWLIAVTAGLAYRAKTVWRNGDRLGVSVEEPLDLNDPVSLVERRLRTFWLRAR